MDVTITLTEKEAQLVLDGLGKLVQTVALTDGGYTAIESALLTQRLQKEFNEQNKSKDGKKSK